VTQALKLEELTYRTNHSNKSISFDKSILDLFLENSKIVIFAPIENCFCQTINIIFKNKTTTISLRASIAFEYPTEYSVLPDNIHTVKFINENTVVPTIINKMIQNHKHIKTVEFTNCVNITTISQLDCGIDVGVYVKQTIVLI
jgi:hypothetical protein